MGPAAAAPDALRCLRSIHCSVDPRSDAISSANQVPCHDVIRLTATLLERPERELLHVHHWFFSALQYHTELRSNELQYTAAEAAIQ